MNLNQITLSYNSDLVVRSLITEVMSNLNIPHKIALDSTLVIEKDIDEETYNFISEKFSKYGIVIEGSEEPDMVKRIKSVLIATINSQQLRARKISALLTDELGYSYAHLSHVFSKATYSSIETFVILVKIEKVKNLLLEKSLSLTEVAYHLDYSSVAHLSSQFKKTTGLTVSEFLKHSKNRKEV